MAITYTSRRIKPVLTALLLSFSMMFFNGCSINPVTGEKQFMLIPQSQDAQIGAQYAPEVEKQLGGKIDDPQLQKYINSVGQNIAVKSHMPKLKFQYTAVNDESVNAMALPGGYIFITRGMLSQMKTEAQLAAVLGHESAHVTARHSAQAMSKQIGIDILLSAISREKTPEMAITVAQLAGQLTQLKYSRLHETQADSIGMDYMIRAGYTPNAMIEVMEILETQSKTKPVEFLSSHPSPESRKEDLQNKMAYSQFTQGLKTGQEDYQTNVLDRLKNITPPEDTPKQDTPKPQPAKQ